MELPTENVPISSALFAESSRVCASPRSTDRRCYLPEAFLVAALHSTFDLGGSISSWGHSKWDTVRSAWAEERRWSFRKLGGRRRWYPLTYSDQYHLAVFSWKTTTSHRLHDRGNYGCRCFQGLSSAQDKATRPHTKRTGDLKPNNDNVCSRGR